MTSCGRPRICFTDGGRGDAIERHMSDATVSIASPRSCAEGEGSASSREQRHDRLARFEDRRDFSVILIKIHRIGGERIQAWRRSATDFLEENDQREENGQREKGEKGSRGGRLCRSRQEYARHARQERGFGCSGAPKFRRVYLGATVWSRMERPKGDSAGTGKGR